jgi:co-chaperonin GroES (HSP10)
MPHDYIKLTAKEFDRLKPIGNNVIIECVIPKEEVRPSGLIIVKDPEFFICKDKDGIEATDQSAHLDRYGIVKKAPESLNCKKMDWETDMELKYGDVVWFDFHSGLHCPIIQVEDKEYRIMEYQNLIVAKRRIQTVDFGFETTLFVGKELYEDLEKILYREEIIPLNGYCLFEEISNLPKTKLILPFEHIDKQVGITRYVGNKNKSYKNKKKYDDMDIHINDKVIFRNQVNNLLENDMHRIFSDVPLRYQQRTDILGILN